MPKTLLEDIIYKMLSLLEDGAPYTQIMAKVHISCSSISRVANRYHPEYTRNRAGRPLKLLERDRCHVVHWISTREADNAVEVYRILWETANMKASPDTVRRALKKAGMHAVTKKKKPKLLKRHVTARLNFALQHEYWTVEDWKQVIWSDKTKINMVGSDGINWVWKKRGEGLTNWLVTGTVKFGDGSTMIWGCMFWEGVGMLKDIKGRINGDQYVTILDGPLQQSLREYGKKKDQAIFQQDNNPKHTYKKARNWHNEHGFRCLDWPAQFPDLNPIKHLWQHLKQQLAKYDTPSNC
jgi:transposase